MRVLPFAHAACLLALVCAVAACGKDQAQARDRRGGGDHPVAVTTQRIKPPEALAHKLQKLEDETPVVHGHA